jgi:polygalacturonase
MKQSTAAGLPEGVSVLSGMEKKIMSRSEISSHKGPGCAARALVGCGVLFFWLSGFSAMALEPVLPAANGLAKIFDIRQYGARGDGKSISTTAIQQALNECDKAGGGLVRVPAGTYLSKPVFLGNNTTLQLDAGAILKATDERADFVDPDKTNQFVGFINGKNLLNVSIVGPGAIDGSGIRWWLAAELAGRKTPATYISRPRLVVLTNCKHVHFQDLYLQNSPSFHLVPTECSDVTLTNVTIKAPSDAPNTDALVLSRCSDVRITRSVMDVGDDNICIKSGATVPGRAFASDNITVMDCTFLRGQGLSIGSETLGGVRNVTVRNCTFDGTANGIRIKSQRGKGGIVENLNYDRLTMKNVDPAIVFTCYYLTNSEGDTAQPVEKTTPIYSNIYISNVRATCPQDAGLIAGLPESPVTDVILENVQISAATGFTVKNAKGIHFRNVQITAAKGPPLITENAQVQGFENPATSSK